MADKIYQYGKVTNESWNQDADGNWHFYLNGVEVPDPDGSKAEFAEWFFPPWARLSEPSPK